MIQVALSECRSYEYNLVKAGIQETIDHLGGLDTYFSQGQRIMLKANLLMKKKPEEATTTHPVFMRALADLLTEFGLDVLIADSPGGPFNILRLQSLYAYCGYVSLEENPLVHLNYNVDFIEVQTPESKVLKRMRLIKAIEDVDHIISVSKLKTHGMMRFTGAVKNMFGLIPGVQKAEYHFTLPKIEDFADGLIDICLARMPILSFMDGIVAMEGHGPSAGDPREVGVILASQSPFHLDQVACQIIGLDISEVPMLLQASKRGLIREDQTDFECVGRSVLDFKQSHFVIPKVRGISFFDTSPKILKNFLEKRLKPNPIFKHSACIGCGDCAANCPPKAIEMKAHKPYVKLEICIRCFCCQELCPVKAVAIKRSKFLDRIVKM